MIGSRLKHLPQSLAMTFPLLTRELIEQSARKRTFILRTFYAAALYGFVLWSFWIELGSWSNQSFSFLGRGRDLFRAITILQFWGLYLFLPAMTSGVLTVEKERDTLGLLLLTRLGPWSILFGKLFSRLVPMASFMLLSLPLLAVAYSLGGVEAGEILVLAWALFVTSLQVGALALACSAWCRTTASAFLATYLIGATLMFFIQEGRFDPFGIMDFAGRIIAELGWYTYREGEIANIKYTFFGPWLCLDSDNSPSSIATPNDSLVLAILKSAPILLFTGASLVFARLILWRRAFLQPSNLLLNVFRSLDKLFHRMNQNSFTKGIVLTRGDAMLPDYHPIQWRETIKRSLGTTRYLVRLLLVIEVPVLFGTVVESGTHATQFCASALWIAATLVIVIQSTGLIGLEKSRQTLDVLLTVPMTSEDIVREKFAGVWRMIRMLWIPFATVYLFQVIWMTWIFGQGLGGEVMFGILRGLLATMIYPPLIAALGFHFGMRCRSQTQAVLVTLCAIGALCAIPPVVVHLLDPAGYLTTMPIGGLLWLSPVTAITSTSEFDYNPYLSGRVNSIFLFPWFGLMMHFVAYASLLGWLWGRSLKTFALYVHRNDGQIVDDDDIERLSLLRQQIVGRAVFRATAEDE